MGIKFKTKKNVSLTSFVKSSCHFLLPRSSISLHFNQICAVYRYQMILENKKERANLFSTPLSESNLEIQLDRKELDYNDLSGKFIAIKKDFKSQFFHIYASRLMKMKEKVIKSCSLKWGNDCPIRKLSELSDENNEKCAVIGTIFKYQELKPSILKELSEELQVVPQPHRSNFVSDNDLLILEDEIQRIRLVGKFEVKKFVTGIVIGLLGSQNDGKFEVDDMCFAGVSLSPERPLVVGEDCYLVLLSGLNMSKAESMLALELFVDWIRGDLGSISEQEESAKVCRVLIAGNSVADSLSLSIGIAKSTEDDKGLGTLTVVNHLDNILENLVSSVEVDLMPGEYDPANHVLPQQAMHSSIFQKACQYESFHSVTNPYECLLGGRRILGTSGQPIKDIKSLTDLDDSLEILEKTLFWGHLAPTAPDTLACYPYYEDDPFVINVQPNIYFAGNQPKFQTKMVDMNGQPVRLVTIPSFSKKKSCVIVNLKTLECKPLQFTT